MPKNEQIWPEIGIFGHFGPGLAGSIGALLVGWLVVVARVTVSRKTPIYFICVLIWISHQKSYFLLLNAAAALSKNVQIAV